MTKHNLGVIGVGTAGKRIIEKVSFGLPDALCVSLDDSEWKTLGDKVTEIPLSLNLDRSVGNVKKITWNIAGKLANMLKGLETAVVVAGFGGILGSSAAPIVAQRLKEEKVRVYGVAIMPFKFEKNRLFRAAVALKKMKMVCDGVIVVDNEEFVEKAPQTPLLKAFEMENDWISKFISTLLGQRERFGLSRNEVYEFASSNRNNVLAIGCAEGSSMAEEATFKVSSSLRRQSGVNVNNALMCVVGWRELSVGDISTIVSTFRGTTLCDGEVKTGYYASGERNLTVYALASVEHTRFDAWDPLSQILGDREVDFDVCCDMKLEEAANFKLEKID
ncbi:MAG: hypothetical protein ACUVQ8_06255 [Nitrososphaeria archaeon]